MADGSVAALAPDVTTDGSSVDDAELGPRLKDLRLRRGLSLAQIAARAETSRSLISQIERGVASPSLDTVRRLASALEVPTFSLFLGGLDNQTVVRADQRRVVSYPGTTVRREIVSPTTNGRMIVLWVTFPPGERSGVQPVHHTGEECVVVIRGTLSVQVADDTVQLETGDSMTFDSEMPHTFWNPANEPAEVIFAISPPRI
jgi:transcriptional regulator with XRE-family HTH domain